jgi:hypothetical protein
LVPYYTFKEITISICSSVNYSPLFYDSSLHIKLCIQHMCINDGWMSKIFPAVCGEDVDVPQNAYHYCIMLQH